MMAKNIHQPARSVMKVSAPAVTINFPARAALPLANCQYAPAKQPNAGMRVRKMMAKVMFVRREQMK